MLTEILLPYQMEDIFACTSKSGDRNVWKNLSKLLRLKKSYRSWVYKTKTKVIARKSESKMSFIFDSWKLNETFCMRFAQCPKCSTSVNNNKYHINFQTSSHSDAFGSLFTSGIMLLTKWNQRRYIFQSFIIKPVILFSEFQLFIMMFGIYSIIGFYKCALQASV